MMCHGKAADDLSKDIDKTDTSIKTINLIYYAPSANVDNESTTQKIKPWNTALPQAKNP